MPPVSVSFFIVPLSCQVMCSVSEVLQALIKSAGVVQENANDPLNQILQKQTQEQTPHYGIVLTHADCFIATSTACSDFCCCLEALLDVSTLYLQFNYAATLAASRNFH